MPKSKASEKAAETESVPDTEVAVLPKLSDRQNAVASVSNLEQLRAYIGAPIDWQQIEPSFEVRPQSDFEGVPLIIGGFRFNDSSKFMSPDPVEPKVMIPARFVSMLVAAYDEASGEFVSPWVIVNDGSTGIRQQLTRMITRQTGENAELYSREQLNMIANTVPPIDASKGFRKSEYAKELADGSVAEATTWYIA